MPSASFQPSFRKGGTALALSLAGCLALGACSYLPDDLRGNPDRKGQTVQGARRTPPLNPHGALSVKPPMGENEEKPAPSKSIFAGSTPYDCYSPNGGEACKEGAKEKPVESAAVMPPQERHEIAATPLSVAPPAPEAASAGMSATDTKREFASVPREERKALPGNPAVSLATTPIVPLAPLDVTAPDVPMAEPTRMAPAYKPEPSSIAAPMEPEVAQGDSDDGVPEPIVLANVTDAPPLSDVPETPKRFEEIKAERNAHTEELLQEQKQSEQEKARLAAESTDLQAEPVPEVAEQPTTSPEPEIITSGQDPVDAPVPAPVETMAQEAQPAALEPAAHEPETAKVGMPVTPSAPMAPEEPAQVSSLPEKTPALVDTAQTAMPEPAPVQEMPAQAPPMPEPATPLAARMPEEADTSMQQMEVPAQAQPTDTPLSDSAMQSMHVTTVSPASIKPGYPVIADLPESRYEERRRALNTARRAHRPSSY